MYREHRHPYDNVPPRAIYKRLGPPPLPPLVDYAEERLGPAPQRVAQPQIDYPTPYRQQPLNKPIMRRLSPSPLMGGPTHPQRSARSHPNRWERRQPPHHQMEKFVDNRKRILDEYLKGPPGVRSGAGWTARDNALGQERPHVSKEMAQSVGSLFDPEYHSDMPLPNPECRPVASPVPLPDGGLSDNLRFVSDFVTGKMDTASPPGVEGVVAQSALTEGPYHHEPERGSRTTEGQIGLYATDRDRPVPPPLPPPSRYHHQRVEHKHYHQQQRSEFEGFELHHTVRSADGGQGGQPPLEEVLNMDEGTIQPLFERRPVWDNTWKHGFGSSPTKGPNLQERPPVWQGQSRQNHSPHKDVSDAVPNRSIEPRREPLGGNRSLQNIRTLSSASSTSKMANPAVIGDAPPMVGRKRVPNELHPPPRASPDHGGPSVMRHQSDSLHTSLPFSHHETPESVLTSWEKMPLDDVVQMEEKKSRSPAYQREGKSEEKDARLSGLPLHLSVVPMELDSGSQSEGESSARPAGFTSPMQHTVKSPLNASRLAKDPIYVNSVFTVKDGQVPSGSFLTVQAEAQREAASEPIDGTSSCRSDRPDPTTRDTPNDSLAVGISDLGLATRLVVKAPDVPRKVLHNMCMWAKGQIDKSLQMRTFNDAHSLEVDVRTHVRLLDWMETNIMTLNSPKSISKVVLKRSQFRDGIRNDLKLIHNSVAENLAIEELHSLLNTCPPKLLLQTSTNYSKALDYKLVLKKVGYLSTRQDDQRVKRLFETSRRVKMILGSVKEKRMSVAAVLRECSESGKAAKTSRQKDSRVAGSVGREHLTEGTLESSEGTLATGSMPRTEGQGQRLGYTESTTEGRELPTEGHTLMRGVGPSTETGASCERGVKSHLEQSYSNTNHPESFPVCASQESIHGNALVSEKLSPAAIPEGTITQADGIEVELASSVSASNSQLGVLGQPASSADGVSSLSGSQQIGETSLAVETPIPFTRPEFTSIGLSRVKRVPKEGVNPALLNQLRTWARSQFQALYSLKQFNSVHSTEISVRTSVKWLEWFSSHSNTGSAQMLEKQRMTLHRVVRNEFRGMLLIVKENVAIEEAKTLARNQKVVQRVLSDGYHRKLCWDDLVQRMGYVLPRAEEGDKKAQDLLKKVDQVHVLIENSKRGNGNAKAVNNSANSSNLPSESLQSSPTNTTSSVVKAMPKCGTQTGDQSKGKDKANIRSSRSESNTSTSSETETSGDSSRGRRRRRKQERRRSGHWRSRSRSSSGPRRSCYRQTSRCRESSYDETTGSDAASSRVRASHSLRKRSKSCERSLADRLTPSSDSETEKMKQRYADEEDISLLEMRRKLLQSILDKQQKGQEQVKPSTEAKSVSVCTLPPDSAPAASAQLSSSGATQKTFVMLNSSLVEADVEKSALVKEPTLERSTQLQLAKEGHPSVACETTVLSEAFDYVSEDEDTQTISSGPQGESTSACGKVGVVHQPSTGGVEYTEDGGPSARCTDSQVLKTAAVCQYREREEGEVVSSEDEAPLVIDYMEEGTERKQTAKSSHASLVTSCVLASREAANDGPAPVAEESVSVCELAGPDPIETRTVPESFKHQDDAHVESNEMEEGNDGASYSCPTEQGHPGEDMLTVENASEVKEPICIPADKHREEANTRNDNIGSNSAIFQSEDAPAAPESACIRPLASTVPSIEGSLEAFIAQSKMNSQLIRKALQSSVVREEDIGFAMEASSQQSRGVGRQLSAPGKLASAKFALGKEDNWKQTSSFIITVTGDSTSGSEDSEDEVATPSPPPPPPPPPPLFFAKVLDDLPPRVIPPLPMDLGLPVSPGFKPKSILVSESGPSTSSAETEGATAGKSVVTSAVAVAAPPPAKIATKDGEGGDSSQKGTVSMEVAAPVKVGNSIRSSSLRLPQRWGGSAQGSVESGGHVEVGVSSGKGKESAVKQVVGRKREASTSNDGSRPAAKCRSVSVNASTVHPETKSPAKSQWKQVEHEVQEARRQLTRIKAKKCLKLVQAMESEAAKQRAEVKQEQQRLNLLTQQLTSSTQEASELEMKVDLLKKQLDQARDTLRTKQNRIGRLQKEVKTTMTSLSAKKETLSTQTELLNEEKQKLRNFRDILKSGTFASLKPAAKSIVPLRKRTSPAEESVTNAEQVGRKKSEKTAGISEAADKVEVTTSGEAATLESAVSSPTVDALATSSAPAASQSTTQPAITDHEAMAPVSTSASTIDDVHINSSNLSVTSDPVVPFYTEETIVFSVTTETDEVGSQPPPSQPPLSPLQPLPLLTSLPSPNTVKRNQPVIALERLPEDVLRGDKKEEGEEEEGEDGALNVRLPKHQALKEAMHEVDGASTVSTLASQPDFLKQSQEVSGVGHFVSGQPKAHSQKLEMIVQRLKDQASVEMDLSGWLTSRMESVVVRDSEGDSPELLQGQGMQDVPTGSRQEEGEGTCTADVAEEEVGETSLECIPEAEQKENSSLSAHTELISWEGKGKASQHSQMEPTYAGLPCIHLSRNGIALLSEKLGHVSNGPESPLKLPQSIVKQLTLKSQGAPASVILPHATTSSTDACSDNSSSRSAPSRSRKGLQGYSSPLLCLRSYIASPQFWRHHPYRLKSDTFISRVNPKQVMCRYGLQGVCRDSSCDKQHWKDVTEGSSRHVMEELSLLHPQALGIDTRYLTAKSGPKYSSMLKKLVVKYVDSHVRQVLQNGGDPLLDLLHKIRSSVKTSGGIHFITSSHLSTNEGSLSSFVSNDNSDVTPFLDQSLPPLKDVREEGRLDVQQVFGGPLAITSVKDPDQLSAQESRYFSHSKVVQIGEMEKYLEEHPQDVEAWLSLVEDMGKSFGDDEAGVTAAIKMVERSLQSNPTSVRLLCRRIQLLHMCSGKDVGGAVSDAVLTTGKEVPVAAIILEHAWAYELPSDTKRVCLDFIPLVLKHKCKEVGSADAVELAMVAAQVDIVLRHPERALAAVKSFLSDHSSSLTPSHCVLVWLCHISISRLGQLPSSLFTHRDCLDIKQPLRLLSKEPFVLCFGDWFAQTAQLGQKQRPPVIPGSPHSTPLPKVSVASLEPLHQQWMESFSEALSSCMENMAGLSAEEAQKTLQPLWLSIAAVEEACGHTEECIAGLRMMVEASGGSHAFIKGYQTLLAAVDADNASQILANAFALHARSPQMCYTTAKHEVFRGNTDIALQCLVALVEQYLEQPCSEAVQPHTAALIYRKLLGQYVPGDLLASLPTLAEDRPPREEMGHLWLCYSLLVELSPLPVDDTVKEHFADPEDVFEAAVHSQTNSPDRKLVWKQYLKFLCAKASREGATLQDFKSFTSCTQRCLLAVDHEVVVAEENSDCSIQVDDYTFHNEIVEMHVSLLPDQDQPMAYRQWMRILPHSDCIIAKAALMAVRQSHSNIKWVQGWLASYLEEHSKSVALWKIAIKLECSLKRYREARWMFQEALKNVPISGSLWKEYVMFEVDQMKDVSGTAAKQLPDGVAELFKIATQNGIRVSDVMQPFTHPSPRKSIPA